MEVLRLLMLRTSIATMSRVKKSSPQVPGNCRTTALLKRITTRAMHR